MQYYMGDGRCKIYLSVLACWKVSQSMHGENVIAVKRRVPLPCTVVFTLVFMWMNVVTREGHWISHAPTFQPCQVVHRPIRLLLWVCKKTNQASAFGYATRLIRLLLWSMLQDQSGFCFGVCYKTNQTFLHSQGTLVSTSCYTQVHGLDTDAMTVKVLQKGFASRMQFANNTADSLEHHRFRTWVKVLPRSDGLNVTMHYFPYIFEVSIVGDHKDRTWKSLFICGRDFS